jgi:hypothetical protein
MKRTGFNQVVRDALSEPYNLSLEETFEVIDYTPTRRRRHLTRSVLALLAALMGGCASIPTGELQLGPQIAADMKGQTQAGTQSLSRGRPVYLESYAYPQMLESGDIWAGGQVLVYLGREELSLDQVVGDLSHKADAEPAPAAASDSKVVKRAKSNKKSTPKKTALVN